MISASLSLVSQALTQECKQGARGAKGSRQEAPDGSQCLSVYTQVYTSAFAHFVLRCYKKPFGKTHTDIQIDKTHKSHSQMLGKFEYTRGPIFKVVLEC